MTIANALLSINGKKPDRFPWWLPDFGFGAKLEVKIAICPVHLFKKYPDIKTMSQASLIQLQEDIKTIGLYRNKAKNLLAMSKMLIDKYDGKVPSVQKN